MAWRVLAAIALAAAAAPDAVAQTEPTTLWSFLGIGADQNSSNPAIQAAAKAKAAKHEICKKKKAIQYLAGMGCSPEHPEVGPALIAAMGDPDEPVRYEAVKAVLQTAAECQSRKQSRETRKAVGCMESCHDHCKQIKKKICECIDRLFGKAPPKERKCKEKMEECHEKVKECLTGKPPCVDPSKEDCQCGNGHGPCCSDEMREKLRQLAYGRDEKGCFLETSERVRTVAEQALKACAACSGGACGDTETLDQVVRELPAVDERELPDGDSDGECVSERAIIAVPDSDPYRLHESAPVGHPVPTPLPEPILAPPATDSLTLPPPTPPMDHSSQGPLRSVLVRNHPPARAQSEDGGSTRSRAVAQPGRLGVIRPFPTAAVDPLASDTGSETGSTDRASSGRNSFRAPPASLAAPAPPQERRTRATTPDRLASLPHAPIRLSPDPSPMAATLPNVTPRAEEAPRLADSYASPIPRLSGNSSPVADAVNHSVNGWSALAAVLVATLVTLFSFDTRQLVTGLLLGKASRSQWRPRTRFK
jgi:hypothetical protein